MQKRLRRNIREMEWMQPMCEPNRTASRFCVFQMRWYGFFFKNKVRPLEHSSNKEAKLCKTVFQVSIPAISELVIEDPLVSFNESVLLGIEGHRCLLDLLCHGSLLESWGNAVERLVLNCQEECCWWFCTMLTSPFASLSPSWYSFAEDRWSHKPPDWPLQQRASIQGSWATAC